MLLNNFDSSYKKDILCRSFLQSTYFPEKLLVDEVPKNRNNFQCISNMKQILRGAPKILVLKMVIKILDQEVHSVKNFIFSELQARVLRSFQK